MKKQKIINFLIDFLWVVAAVVITDLIMEHVFRSDKMIIELATYVAVYAICAGVTWLVKYLFRRRKDFKNDIIIWLIVLLLGVFAFSAYKLVNTLLEYSEGEKTYEQLSSDYVVYVDTTTPNTNKEDATESVSANTNDTILSPPDDTDTTDTTADDSNDVAGESEIVPIIVDFDSLLKQNKDVVGWLYCADTPINYPVVQSSDNNYYLRRMLNKKYNISGSIFMDYRNGADCSSLNTIIYGHNMKNDTMFGTLTKYTEQSYYDAHPVIWYLTPNQNYKIELIAGYVTPSTSDAYINYKSMNDLKEYIAEAITASTFVADMDATAVERIVTLSTCSYEYSDARYVLIGLLEPVK